MIERPLDSVKMDQGLKHASDELLGCIEEYGEALAQWARHPHDAEAECHLYAVRRSGHESLLEYLSHAGDNADPEILEHAPEAFR